jgi:hypothetical protein
MKNLTKFFNRFKRHLFNGVVIISIVGVWIGFPMYTAMEAGKYCCNQIN